MDVVITPCRVYPHHHHRHRHARATVSVAVDVGRRTGGIRFEPYSLRRHRRERGRALGEGEQSRSRAHRADVRRRGAWCAVAPVERRRSVVRSFDRSVVRSFGRSVVRSFDRSIVRSFGRALGVVPPLSGVSSVCSVCSVYVQSVRMTCTRTTTVVVVRRVRDLTRGDESSFGARATTTTGGRSALSCVPRTKDTTTTITTDAW